MDLDPHKMDADPKHCSLTGFFARKIDKDQKVPKRIKILENYEDLQKSTGERKTEAQAIFLYLFTLCFAHSANGKFVVCSFVST